MNRTGLKPLPLDLRDKAYQRHLIFGAPSLSQLPTEYTAGGTVSDINQLNGKYGGSSYCTDFSTVALAEREDGQAYSREYHAQKESHIQNRNIEQSGGTDLRTAFRVATEYGFLPQSLAPFSWRDVGAIDAADPAKWDLSLDATAQQNAHPGFTWITGPYDYFDSVRAALWDKRDKNGTVSAGIPWYSEWETVEQDGVLPTPTKPPTTLHDTELFGWVIKNGRTYLKVNSWQGESYGDKGIVYLSRDILNAALTYSGAAAGCLDPIDPTQVNNLYKRLLTILQTLVDFYLHRIYVYPSEPQKPVQTPPVAPPTPQPAPVPTPAPNYLWDTPESARHSLRLICDEEGLTVDQKNLMSQVVHCESGYRANIVHPNKKMNGTVASTDYGICQWNDYWHAKEISPDEALHNPEKAVRLMCQYVKQGQIHQWVCYSTGMYQNYSS
jgi:hypothetical protein